MAQPTMNSFFAVKKKNSDFQPSKRLKVQHSSTVDQPAQIVPDSKQVSAPVARISTRSRKQIQTPVGDLKVAETKTRVKSVSTSRTKRQPSKAKNQPSIENTLRVTRSSSRSSSPVVELEEDTKHVINPEDLGELTTAACDDHCVSPPSTPTKRTSSTKTTSTAGKRSRNAKVVRKDIISEIEGENVTIDTKQTKGYDFSKFINSSEGQSKTVKTSRKKLVMKRRSDEILNEKLKEVSEDKTISISDISSGTPAPAEVPKTKGPSIEKLETKSKSKLTNSAKNIKDNGKSETKTGTRGGNNEEKKVEETPTLKLLDPSVVKARLAKSGKLAELQERLAQFSEAAAKVKKEKQVQRLADLKAEKERANEAAKPKKVPAFERYHTIAAPVPPSLTLPFRYKLLLDTFHSADTVISMLYKRFEICTFSKLKKAVQVMTRRAFEEKTLGQMKTVYPEAYILRQEKGIPIPGTGEIQSWQLTVSPDLGDEKDNDGIRDKQGRLAFTAIKLLDRKALFHSLLVDIVKGHHTEFLSSLDRPLEVADDKITRWHPLFRVDEVPEIPAAELPQPPDVKKFTTAIEVLEEARTKNTVLNARVQKALENMAKQKKESESKDAVSTKPEPSDSKKNKKDVATKGIPQSLLDRIRAKEAERDIRAMIISPEDEKKNEMISRLPSVVNILRTYFVTNKKPCISMEDAIMKVKDSCRSKLGPVEAEAHLDLLAKLVPKWISVIQIKKGKYIKIDKNQDTKLIIEKINSANKT